MEQASDTTSSMIPSLRHLAPSLVVAGVLPVVGYIVLRPHVGSDAVALAAVMVFPIADILIARFRRGRIDPIGIISMIGIGIGLVGALVTGGDATLLKLRESGITGVFGLVCLGSLAMRRPLMFYLGRSFATEGDPDRVREFDERWQLPGVPARFRFVTAVWGVALVAEAGLRTILALSVPTETFLVVTPIINWTFIGGLVLFTITFARRSEQRVRAIVDAEALEQPATS